MSEASADTSPQSDTIDVMLVDDHDISRAGTRVMLDETEFRVVAEASSGIAAIELARQTKPRLTLLDIRMAGMDGLEVLLQLKREHPQMAVVMLTTYENPAFMARALAGGAAGYLLKGVTRPDLLKTLRAVAQGEMLLSTLDLSNSLRAMTDRAIQTVDLPNPLTDRELEVLRLLATGLKNQEIADRLFLSEATVKSHILHLIAKIGVSDRVQAAVWAARYGLLAFPTDSE